MATTAAGQAQTQAPSGPSLPPAPPVPTLPVPEALGAAAKAVGGASVAAVGVTAATLHALSQVLAKQRMINRRWLASHAGTRPGAATLRQLEVERQREMAFARMSAGRVTSAMPRALGLASPEARQAAVKQLLSNERRFTVQQATESMRRLQGAVNFDRVAESSPLGAMWLLGPAQDHTEGCLHMQRRFWPWAVLQRVHPPRHHGCTGYLIGLDEAIGSGLMSMEDVPTLYDAINDAAGVMMEGAAERLLAELEVREQLIERGVDVGQLARIPWLGEGYVAEAFESQLHPRDFKGRWKVSGLSHPAVGQDLHAAASAIERATGRPVIPMEVEKLPDEDSATARSRPGGKIAIQDSGGPFQRSAIVHEYAHHLDRSVNEDDWMTQHGEEVRPLEQAFNASPTIKAIRNDQIEILKGDPTVKRDILPVREMFARAFEQYVALHGGDEKLLADLRRTQGDKYLSFLRWSDEEFKPIERELEAFLARFHGPVGEAFDAELHPRDFLGRWRRKLGGARLQLKGEKRLTERQAHAAVTKVAHGVVDFYGGERAAVEPHHEPEYLATVGSDARFRHPGEAASGLLYGTRIMDRVRDPDLGVADLRVVAHEAVHSLSGTRPGPLPGISQEIEEGGAEVLSLWYWHHKAQEFDGRDATRAGGKWSEGLDSLAHHVAYREWTEALLRRAASRVGWDRAKLIDEIERVFRGDHTERLRFRDASDPHFALPPDLPQMPRAEGDGTNAVALIRWLVHEDGGGGVFVKPDVAAAALARGEPSAVRPEDVPQLVEHLRTSERSSLHQLQVEGHPNLFRANARDLPREQMPQIPSAHLPGFMDFLREHRVMAAVERAAPAGLRATQNQINGAAVAAIVKGWEPDKGGILMISREGDVLDGHHRWAAAALHEVSNPGHQIDVLRFTASTDRMLQLMREYNAHAGVPSRRFGEGKHLGATG